MTTRREALAMLALTPLLAWVPARRALATEELATSKVDAVFLLGADSQDSAGYFAAAQAYYERLAPRATFVPELRSLLDLREALAALPRPGRRPFSRIVVVAHGADWQGLGVPLVPRGPNATLSRMRDAHDDGSFPPLDGGELDSRTEVVLESCGLGARPDYLHELGRLLAGDRRAPKIIASLHQIGFRAQWADGVAVAAERFELEHALVVVPGAPGEIGAARRRLALARIARELRVSSLETETLLSERPIEISLWVPPAFTDNRMRLTQHLAMREEVQDLLVDYHVRLDTLSWRVIAMQADQALVRGVGTQISAVRNTPIA